MSEGARTEEGIQRDMRKLLEGSDIYAHYFYFRDDFTSVCIYMCVCVCVCVKNDQTILYTTNMYNLLYVIISH